MTTETISEPTPAELPSADAPPAAKEKKKTDWKAEAKGIFWLVLAVLGFHSFVAKPFYIPSESMLPGLLVSDRLVVSKFPYGWSFASLTFHPIGFIRGRIIGHVPERGDVVIVTPPGTKEDYIKRVIGLPGDVLEVRGGTVILNGVPVKRGPLHYVDIPDYGGDPSADGLTCDPRVYPGALTEKAGGKNSCRLAIIRETLPNGRSYDTVESGYIWQADDYAPTKIPADHVFLMGDNRDHSADSRFSLAEKGLGGAVPWEYLGGRAEFITFSLDGGAVWWNPISWLTSLRGNRAGTTLHPSKDG